MNRRLLLGTLSLCALLNGCADPVTPQSTTTASSESASPVTSNQEEPTAKESGTANEANVPLPIEEWTFKDVGGRSLTRQEVISKAKVSPDVYTKLQDRYSTIFSRIESAINYFPDEQTVRANLNIPAGQQLDREQYFTVVSEYQDIVFDTIISGEGELRTKFDRLGRDTAFYRGLTIGSGDKELYGVKIISDVLAKQKVTILDNGGSNSIGANAAPDIGEFRYYSPTMDDLTVPHVPLNVDPAEYEPTYQISGTVRLIELK